MLTNIINIITNNFPIIAVILAVLMLFSTVAYMLTDNDHLLLLTFTIMFLTILVSFFAVFKDIQKTLDKYGKSVLILLVIYLVINIFIHKIFNIFKKREKANSELEEPENYK